MKDIITVAQEKPKLIAKTLHRDVKVTLKVDGISFQMIWDDDEEKFEYRKGSKDELKLGEKIDDLSLMFGQHYINAIDHLENYKKVIDDYKFLTFEIFNNTIYLLSAVSKKGELIEKTSVLKEIADDIDAKIAPVLFEGELSDLQQSTLAAYIQNPSSTTDNFKSFIFSLFNTYEGFPHNEWNAIPESIEGVVFSFKMKDGKIAQYKLVDPVFRYNKDTYKAEVVKNELSHKVEYDTLASMLIGWMSENAENKDENKIKSLNENFKKLAKDYKLLNELTNYAAKLPQVNVELSEKYGDKEIKKLIKNMGQNMLTLYVNFILLFSKGKHIAKEQETKYHEILQKI